MNEMLKIIINNERDVKKRIINLIINEMLKIIKDIINKN